MALTEVTSSWQSVTLSVDEVWFAETGDFRIHNTGTPDNNDGGTVRQGDSIRLPAGSVIHWRKARWQGGETKVRLARVAVSV